MFVGPIFLSKVNFYLLCFSQVQIQLKFSSKDASEIRPKKLSEKKMKMFELEEQNSSEQNASTKMKNVAAQFYYP